MSVTSALITAEVYGLGNQYLWDKIGFILGTLAMSGSLVFVACSFTLLAAQFHSLIISSLAIPLGGLHGWIWASRTQATFESVLANFPIPLTLCWVIGSISGLAVVPFICAWRTPIQLGPTPLLAGLGIGLGTFFGVVGLLALCMVGLLLDDGVTQHVVVSPSQHITALVIRDDCGATCGCMMRVDVQSQERYVREVYRSNTACDAVVTWQSPVLLHVRDDSGREQFIDMRTIGLQP